MGWQKAWMVVCLVWADTRLGWLYISFGLTQGLDVVYLLWVDTRLECCISLLSSPWGVVYYLHRLTEGLDVCMSPLGWHKAWMVVYLFWAGTRLGWLDVSFGLIQGLDGSISPFGLTQGLDGWMSRLGWHKAWMVVYRFWAGTRLGWLYISFGLAQGLDGCISPLGWHKAWMVVCLVWVDTNFGWLYVLFGLTQGLGGYISHLVWHKAWMVIYLFSLIHTWLVVFPLWPDTRRVESLYFPFDMAQDRMVLVLSRSDTRLEWLYFPFSLAKLWWFYFPFGLTLTRSLMVPFPFWSDIRLGCCPFLTT